MKPKQYESTTTLRRIREADPCEGGWLMLLKHLGKTKADDEPLALEVVLDSNGLDEALWVLSYAMPDDRLARHFQAWCAEQVLHVFEADQPAEDDRVKKQIDMLRNDAASKGERRAARDDAHMAGGCNVGIVATRDAVRDTAWAAARAIAWDVARVAKRDSVAEWAGARHKAWVDAWAAIEKQLRTMLGARKADGK